MTWVRIDDQFAHHPKVISVGPLGMALHVAALCYCARYLTDGFVPELAVSLLVDFGAIEFADEEVSADKVATWLVKWGMWEKVQGGYAIHDYFDYQPSRAQIERDRAAKVAAGQAGGQASAQARGQAEGKQTATTPQADAQAKSKPVPVPVPVPDLKTTATPVARDQNLVAMTTGHENTIAPIPSQAKADILKDWAERVPDSDHGRRTITYVWRQTALQTHPSLAFAESIFKRLEAAGWPLDMEAGHGRSEAAQQGRHGRGAKQAGPRNFVGVEGPDMARIEAIAAGAPYP